MSAKVIVCDCLGSARVHTDALEAVGHACSRLHTNLCGAQSDVLARELAAAPGAVVACGQEVARVGQIAAEAGLPAPACVDVRDRAGWSSQAQAAGPKQAALVADAALGRPPTPATDVTSEGLCLILGPAERAIPAAERLAGPLSVTVLLGEAAEPPLDRRFDVAVGRLRGATGALGGFEVAIDALRELVPGGRGALGFGPPRDGARSACDVILDLRGGTPLFPAHHEREGYLRPDPGDPLAVADAILAASQLVGTFEKPLHVRLEPLLCAHSRARQPACSRCLDVCPTGAIVSAGDHVAVDPMVCAGCGACSAVCPSQAIAYDDPAPDHVFRRLRAMAEAFRAAGGEAPRLLVHEAHGAEMIALSARFGEGLPAAVIPMEVAALATFGHAEMLAALGSGFAAVDLLPGPRSDRATLEAQRVLAEAVAGGDRLRLLDVADPDDLPAALRTEVPPPLAGPILAMGTRRQVTRSAARALRPEAPPIPLPQGAPYGAVLVDTDACTLCLACASLCPSGALGDNPDRPELRFQEDACLQCNLCANVCPEDAITLEPRLDVSDDALSQRVLHAEEPAACVECGALFGVQSTIERVAERLAGRHSMFGSNDAARLIRMCDDCRVKAQFGRANPMAAGERPRVRTADDYGPPPRRDH